MRRNLEYQSRMFDCFESALCIGKRWISGIWCQETFLYPSAVKIPQTHHRLGSTTFRQPIRSIVSGHNAMYTRFIARNNSLLSIDSNGAAVWNAVGCYPKTLSPEIPLLLLLLGASLWDRGSSTFHLPPAGLLKLSSEHNAAIPRISPFSYN